jgi:hypothetical protein
LIESTWSFQTCFPVAARGAAAGNLCHRIVFTCKNADVTKHGNAGIGTAAGPERMAFSSPESRHFNGYKMNVKNAKWFS